MKVLRKIISSDNEFSNDMPRQMTDENIKTLQGREKFDEISEDKIYFSQSQ